MQTKTQRFPVSSSTLHTLISELGAECQNVIALIHQLQLPQLSDDQRGEILAELLSATVSLHAHCDEDFQALISDEITQLPDQEEA